MSESICSDCPPVGYPTDETRCLPCPRRAPMTALTTPPAGEDKGGRAMTDDKMKALREAIEDGHLRVSVSVGVGSPVATIGTRELLELVHAGQRVLSSPQVEEVRREALLREALQEVMEWISGWSPDFTDDDDWPATKAKVTAALSPQGG